MTTLMLNVKYSAAIDALVCSTFVDPERYFCVAQNANELWDVWPIGGERLGALTTVENIPAQAFYAMQDAFRQDV